MYIYVCMCISILTVVVSVMKLMESYTAVTDSERMSTTLSETLLLPMEMKTNPVLHTYTYKQQ